MLMASLEPATINSKSDCACCSTVGLITKSPFTRPTFTPAIGPSKGISEIVKAADEPNIAAISGEQSGSTDKTVLIT